MFFFCRIGIGHGYVERQAYGRRSSAAGCSQSRSFAVDNELSERLQKTEDELRQAKQMIEQQNQRQQQQSQMLEYLFMQQVICNLNIY